MGVSTARKPGLAALLSPLPLVVTGASTCYEIGQALLKA